MNSAEQTYLHVVNRSDLLVSQDLTRLISDHAVEKNTTCRIIVACPTTYQAGVEVWMEKLKKQLNSDMIIFQSLEYDPGDNNACQKAADKLVSDIGEKHHIDGLVYNFHGHKNGETGKIVEENGMKLLDIVQYKVIGLATLLNTLIDKKLLSKGSRVAVAGSEAARGVVDMGFPVPKMGNSLSSYLSILDGSTFDLSKPYPIYAHTEAIKSLYIGAMARRNPEIYFCSISPGFTKDSLIYDIGLDPGLRSRIFLCVMWYMFPLLKKGGIGQDFGVAAKNFFSVISDSGGTDSKFPTGALFAAAEGTCGPICDQSENLDGCFLSDSTKQDLAYEAVHKYLK